jgi:hypothetical protein
MRLIGISAFALLKIFKVTRIVARKPMDVTIALKGHDMSRDPVEKPAIMGDNNCATGKSFQRFLQRANGIHIEVIGGLVEQQ